MFPQFKPNLKLTATVLLQARAMRLVAAGLTLLVLAGSASLLAARVPDNGSSIKAGPRVSAPKGVRIKVQVLNATRRPGLAARATRYLRDRGFDVVEAGTSSTVVEKTQVLDRTGKADAARLVALAFSVARAESRRDSSRYVDVTVLIGADWSPPPGAFGS